MGSVYNMHIGKVRTNITIDKDLLVKSRQYRLSISGFLDVELRKYLAVLEHGIAQYSPYRENPVDTKELPPLDDKPNNLISDKGSQPRACGVAWYPCGFGSHRHAFKSHQAHFFTFN
jgi:hypothetical protein